METPNWMNFLGRKWWRMTRGWFWGSYTTEHPKVFKIVYRNWKSFPKRKAMFLPIVGQVSSIIWLANESQTRSWAQNSELTFPPKPWGIITKSHDVRPWRLTPATFSGDSKCSEQPQGQGPTENSQKTRTRHGTISSFHGGEPWIGGGSHSEWDPQQGCWYQQPWQEWYRRCHFSPRYLWNPFYPR